MSVKCEEPLDELTVEVWLLYDHPNLKYCTFYKRDGIKDGRTNGRTDRRTIQTLDAPGGPFRPWHLKEILNRICSIFVDTLHELLKGN